MRTEYYPPAIESAEVSQPLPEPPQPSWSALAVAELLWEKRVLLRRAALVGLLVGALAALLIPARYTSTARLMSSQDSQSSLLTAAAMSSATPALGTFAAGLLGRGSTEAQFVGILESRSVRDTLVDRFHLFDVYGVSRWEDARRQLADRTDISVDRKSSIITVAVEDRDPLRAMALSGAYIQELNRQSAQLSTSAASREREFIEQRLKVVRRDLDRAARDFSRFSSQNTALEIGEQAKAMLEGAAAVQAQLIAAESELSGLEQVYTGNNVRVRSARARVSELRRQLEKLGGAPPAASAALSGSSSETGGEALASPPPAAPSALLGAGRPQEAAADNLRDSDSVLPSIRRLPQLGVRYAELYRDVKIQESLFEILTKQYELAKIEEARSTPVVRVLDQPSYPEKPSFPPRLGLMLGVMLLFTVAAGALVVAQQRWQETDPASPEKQLATRVFNSLNHSRVRFWKRTNGS